MPVKRIPLYRFPTGDDGEPYDPGVDESAGIEGEHPAPEEDCGCSKGKRLPTAKTAAAPEVAEVAEEKPAAKPSRARTTAKKTPAKPRAPRTKK